MLWPLAVLAALALSLGNLWFGDLNQDEGWYLYAGRLVAEGQTPFVDFASTQGPVMSYVYALAWPLVRVGGVAAGRAFTMILGLLGAMGAAWLASRLVPRRDTGTEPATEPLPPGAVPLLNPEDRRSLPLAVGLCTFSLVSLNIYQSYFSTIVKTYALTGLLITAGFLVLSLATGPKRKWLALAAGALTALAVCTRLSAVAVLPAVFVTYVTLGVRRRSPALLQTALLYAVGAGVTGLAVMLPFMLRAPEAFWFGMMEYHGGRDSSGMAKQLAYKVGFMIRLLQAYFVPLALLAAGAACAWGTRRRGTGAAPTSDRSPIAPAACWSIVAVTALHLTAPFPYDDYQVMMAPVFASVLCATLLPRLMLRLKLRSDVLATAVLVLSLASVAASPMLQNWFVGPRDRIWWPLKSQTPLALLRATAADVRGQLGPEQELLTQDTYLAVESGARVPPGMALGPFSYYPDWSRDRADACHVLNRESLVEIIATTPARVAAFSGYGLAISCPSVTELPPEQQAQLWNEVLTRYTPTQTIPHFGQAATTLRILSRE